MDDMEMIVYRGPSLKLFRDGTKEAGNLVGFSMRGSVIVTYDGIAFYEYTTTGEAVRCAPSLEDLLFSIGAGVS